MQIFNLDKNFFLYFIKVYLLVLGGISAITILFLLFGKVQRIIYINGSKKELEKIKGKEHTIFYKVGDMVENKIYDLGKCVLIIKGFATVSDTLRRHWNHNDKLKLSFTIKDNLSINVDLFFDNNYSWKKIEGLHNLSDGINYVNQYEIVVKENEKFRFMLQMLFVFCITMWVGIIPMLMIFLFTGQITGTLKLNSVMLSEIMIPVMLLPLFFQVIMYFVSMKLQRYDKDLPLAQIIQIFVMAMPAFSILISIIYWYILLYI